MLLSRVETNVRKESWQETTILPAIIYLHFSRNHGAAYQYIEPHLLYAVDTGRSVKKSILEIIFYRDRLSYL